MRTTSALLLSLASLAAMQLVVALPAPSDDGSDSTSIILPESAETLSALTHLERRQPYWLMALFLIILRLNYAPDIHKLIFTYINCKASMDVDWNDPANKSRMYPERVSEPDFDVSRQYPEIENHPSGLYKCDAKYGPSISDRSQYFSMYYFIKYEPVTMAIVKEVIAGVQRDAKGKEAVKKLLENLWNKAKEIISSEARNE
ncbi:hypothetical protein HK102_005976 [Quaeritorhiza haematococci]|nr:hypothetical protein HK102_005976 [Quaeritorhiza haematococci]